MFRDPKSDSQTSQQARRRLIHSSWVNKIVVTQPKSTSESNSMHLLDAGGPPVVTKTKTVTEVSYYRVQLLLLPDNTVQAAHNHTDVAPTLYPLWGNQAVETGMTVEKGQLRNTSFTNLAEVGTAVIVNVKMINQLE